MGESFWSRRPKPTGVFREAKAQGGSFKGVRPTSRWRRLVRALRRIRRAWRTLRGTACPICGTRCGPESYWLAAHVTCEHTSAERRAHLEGR